LAKILVLDDTKANLDAAREQLASHELTLVMKFSDARALIRDRYDFETKTKVPGTAYDIVLTDLFLPGEREGQGDEGFALVGEPIPTGLVLALLAIQKGVGKVAVVSNGNHHAHPMTWALDALQDDFCAEKYSAEANTVLPGRLYSFTGYECPTVGNRSEHQKKSYEERAPLYDIKDWARVVAEITKG
jgi:hypothetical protein